MADSSDHADASRIASDTPLPFDREPVLRTACPSRLDAQAIDWEVHPISPVTKDWIAVASPTLLLTSLLAYFAIVFSGFAVLKNVPKDPTKKDPLWIRSLVIFHNVFLVTLSMYMCGGCLLEAYRNGYSVWGNAYKASETAMAHYIWVFYVSKI